ncbi:MAG TPA: FAD-dependent oxidoreductase [Acidimicrobiales bacterium]|nr:FAD-dependent oxidoreductase [Acidimicrobiales bacterium]
MVIGAGLLGLAAGSALADAGVDALVLEQRRVGHTRSGSHGPSRIFRLGYEDAALVRMALLARDEWRLLEERSGTGLLTTTGQLDLGAGLDEVSGAMRSGGAPVEELAPGAVHERWPGVAWNGPGLWEPESGVLAAERCLEAVRSCSGADLREDRRVVAITDLGRRVTVDTESETISCDVAVLCAGAWNAPLAAAAGVALDVRPSLEQVAYFRGRPGHDPLDLPIFVERSPLSPYGLPTHATETYKVSFHRHHRQTGGPEGGQRRPTVDPDAVEMDPDPRVGADLATVVERLLPGIDPTPVGSERCFYDNSPDGAFIVDRVGRIVVGAGTSGHGFKFGPLWGRMLAALALGSESPVPLAQFRFGSRLLSGAT